MRQARADGLPVIFEAEHNHNVRSETSLYNIKAYIVLL